MVFTFADSPHRASRARCEGPGEYWRLHLQSTWRAARRSSAPSSLRGFLCAVHFEVRAPLVQAYDSTSVGDAGYARKRRSNESFLEGDFFVVAQLKGVVEPLRKRRRVMAGMRPTGQLHVGHLLGALQNFVALSEQADCFYEIADIHALTTKFEHSGEIADDVREMAIDWLAAGLDPKRCTIY